MSAAPLNILTGIHRREDDRETFEFEASIVRQGDRAEWTARVTCDGCYRGRSYGVIEGAAGLTDANIEAEVRKLVQGNISNRISVG